MRRALAALGRTPSHVVVDGNQLPTLAGLGFACTIEAVVAGDATVPSISAASILAKCARDAHMVELDACHPGYGFAIHKGYGTEAHLAALRRLGPSPVHRRSFAPVQFYLSPDRD
jgi:ribonuclease HII